MSDPFAYRPQARRQFYKSQAFTGRRSGWMASRASQSRFAGARATGGAARFGRRIGFAPAVSQKALTKNSGELKGMDTDIVIAGPVISTVSTNADSFVLNLVEPGNGSYNRIGRKIFNKTVRIKGSASYAYADIATTESLSGGYMRMLVVWDKQPSGVLPILNLIIGRTSQDGTETSDMLDSLRFDNTARFSILRDTTIVCNPNSAPPPTGGTENKVYNKYFFDEFIDLKNRTTVFSGDSDPVTIADISSGALYVYSRSNAAVDEKIDWVVEAETSARLRFTS